MINEAFCIYKYRKDYIIMGILLIDQWGISRIT